MAKPPLRCAMLVQEQAYRKKKPRNGNDCSFSKGEKEEELMGGLESGAVI